MPPRVPKAFRLHGITFPVWQLGDGRLASSCTQNGQHRVIKRRALDVLTRDMERIARGIVQAETAAQDLTADDRRDAALAIELRGNAQVSLADAMRFFLTHQVTHRPSPPTPQILVELIAELRLKNRDPKYVADLDRDLKPFAARFPDLANTDSQAIREFLASHESGPRRRDNIRDAIVTLSRFARKRKHLPDQRTAAEEIERLSEGTDVATWAPREMAILLDHVSDRWLPFVALAAFAGMRTSEIFRLQWSAVKWEQRVIAIHRRVAKKVRIARKIPISDNLLALLAPWRESAGALYPNAHSHGSGPSGKTLPAWKTLEKHKTREAQRLLQKTGLHWKDNALRHSFGSYRLALTKDIGAVALEMGTSSKMIRKHYHDPKDESEARAWFSLRAPDSLDNVLPLPLDFGT